MVEVLLCLAEHPGETVFKGHLIQKVWGGTFVTDDVLTRCISELRKALEDDAKEPRIIQTISKKGYRLLQKVERVEDSNPPDESPAGMSPSANEMPRDLQGLEEYLRRASKVKAFTLEPFLQRARTYRFAIPVLVLLLAGCLLSYWFLHRQANIHWAREKALPEIAQLIEGSDVFGNLNDAYVLAERAEAYVPHDSTLAKLMSECSLRINVRTEPAGARIYFKDYNHPDSEWRYLGVSPLENVRVPIGNFRWRVEKEGYETVWAAASTWDLASTSATGLVPYNFFRVLDRKGSIPPGMVRVAGAKTEIGELNDFFIDKYEVTNKQYKRFIDSGAYRDQKYWKQPFLDNGKALTWKEGMTRFVDQTGRPGPATWQAGDYPTGEDDFPVSGISWYEAAAYADFIGKSLPTRYHWSLARGEYTPLVEFPWLGGFAILAPYSNFNGDGPVAVGSLPGLTAYGAYDMAGNVREWVWNQTPKGRLVRGGAWNDNTYMFNLLGQAPPMNRSPKNGFRCAIYPSVEKIPKAAFQEEGIPSREKFADLYKEKPVVDSVFQAYRGQFSYDKTGLDAHVDWEKESPEDWTQEKITFDAAYGRERVIAYLFLPRNTPPPYQTVVYFPGAASMYRRSSEDLESYFLSFIIKNGRAVLYPIYKGTYERGNDSLTAIFEDTGYSHQSQELLIQQVKDLRRSIDYLETRPDIDTKKLAYYGVSRGAKYGVIIPAVEPRLRVSVLIAGSIETGWLPEVNPINYVTRVKIPTLMLNGKYDTDNPAELTIQPMYDLLGTPAADKRLILYETDHLPPRNEYIKETLVWLDRYLGPVQ